MTDWGRKNTEMQWSNFRDGVGTRLLITTAFYPVELAKTLIQIGYEPIPPRKTKTIFGKPALGLPNIFSYVKYIHSKDGMVGCYRGLSARLCSTFLTTVSHSYIVDRMKIPEAALDEQDLTADDRRELFVKTLLRDLVATTTTIVISQPFHVVGVRLIAQFVNEELKEEAKYGGIINSLATIFKEEGWTGWFSGLFPRLFGEVTTVFLVSTLTYTVNSYLVPDDKSLQHMFGVGVDFLIKNLTYPFQVVGVCMAVNRSGLHAGAPYMMPLYSNWIHCMKDLSELNQLKRGSGLFWRYVPEHSGLAKPLPPVPIKPPSKLQFTSYF